MGDNKGEVEMRREKERGTGRSRRKWRRMRRNCFKIFTTGEFEGIGR